MRFGQEKMSYSEVIRRFAEREEHEPGKAYLARITPYAYVAAEMLGADLKILGIYKSAATGKTTYNSYFVVRKDALESTPAGSPTAATPRSRTSRPTSGAGKPEAAGAVRCTTTGSAHRATSCRRSTSSRTRFSR